MEWKPLTRQALDEMISKGLEAMDDAVQDAWQTMRIEPEKWRCSPWGDLGGGFWVVAEMDGHVVWYNDIEEGFNTSRFTKRGTIDEYFCNHDGFEEFLLGISQAREAETWPADVEATTVPTELRGGGTILRRQTTYWEVRSARGSLWRLHFREKAEVRFVNGEFSRMELVEVHSILDQYLEPWAQLFFSGTPIDPDVLTKALADRIAEASGGWRALEEYLNGSADLRKCYGLLMRGPKSVVNIGATLLDEMGLSASVLESPGRQARPQALLMDRNAIVAQAFRFETRSAI